ncbi:hypothetical protein TKK_0018979 [Trichogramma kaykai]|uniref:Protein AAR2 homolog n=1 Tax=Trichogramma kaykai TaxID=54128 RepID=A0ABD2VVR0_9HYME
MSSESLEMDPELAKRLLIEGGTFVIFNVPDETDFGIDLKSWSTGVNFKGIKMIPKGLHFIHYSATDKYGGTAPKVGFFYIFKQSEFLVKRWDKKEERVDSDVASAESINRLKENIKELDRYLGVYPYDLWKPWCDLTDKINERIIERCQPECGFVCSALELVNTSDACRPKGTDLSDKTRKSIGATLEDKEKNLLPDLKPKPGTELRLTEIPEKLYPADATPSEITKHSLDTSYAFNTILNKLEDPMDIIGELQLAFVSFLVGQSLEAFEHWKKLVSIICAVDTLIPNKRAIYVEFLKNIENQLNYVPEEVLCDIVANNNFIYHNLRKLFTSIESNEEIDDRLKSMAERMKERLTDKFLWDFENLCEDEDAPVVVDLN